MCNQPLNFARLTVRLPRRLLALARKLKEDVAFRVLGADNFPSHRTIGEFRRHHLEDFKRLFVRVVRLAGLVGAVRFAV